jgi:hypothetical protein
MTTPEEFSARCVAVASDLALLFAHEPDEKVESSLARMRVNLVANLANVFPTYPASRVAEFVDQLILTIQARRREIERGPPRMSDLTSARPLAV